MSRPLIATGLIVLACLVALVGWPFLGPTFQSSDGVLVRCRNIPYPGTNSDISNFILGIDRVDDGSLLVEEGGVEVFEVASNCSHSGIRCRSIADEYLARIQRGSRLFGDYGSDQFVAVLGEVWLWCASGECGALDVGQFRGRPVFLCGPTADLHEILVPTGALANAWKRYRFTDVKDGRGSAIGVIVARILPFGGCGGALASGGSRDAHDTGLEEQSGITRISCIPDGQIVRIMPKNGAVVIGIRREEESGLIAVHVSESHRCTAVSLPENVDVFDVFVSDDDVSFGWVDNDTGQVSHCVEERCVVMGRVKSGSTIEGTTMTNAKSLLVYESSIVVRESRGVCIATRTGV